MVGLDPTLLDEWLSRTARRLPMKDAIVCGSDRWSYRALDDHVSCLAEVLIELGVARQDRVAVLLGNCPETVVSLFATLRAGATCVPLEGSTKARRLRYILEDSGARVLIAKGNQARVLAEALESWDKKLTIIWLGPSPRLRLAGGISSVTWESALARLNSAEGQTYTAPSGKFPRRIDLDLAAIIYTSATTGRAKGVMCTHYNMIAAARSIIEYLGNDEHDIILDVLPLSFGYGLYQVLVSCMVGATVVLERSFLYPHIVLNRLAEESVTAFPLVPSIAAMLLRMENIAEYDFSTLRYITNAGAALPVGHLRRLRQLVPHAQVFNMYGMTECVRVCYLSGPELDQRPASVGHAMPNCEVQIVDAEGLPAAPGEAGELVIRGSNVMQGYWNDPEMSAQTYQAGLYPVSRWLHSGDFFRADEEGYLYFLGRRDDMIKTRGERVSPKEIEDVICELESVVEAAAIGVPDEILGQAIKVVIVDGQGTLSEKDILQHCARRLEPLMVPKFIQFVEALPKTGRGKINRRELQTAKGE